MHPVLFQICSITIYSYGFFVALAMLAAFFLSNKRAALYGLPKNLVTDILFLIFVSGVVGARLFYVLQHFDEYRSDGLKTLAVQEGGLVWYGGFIVAASTALFYGLLKKAPILKLCDFFSPILAFGHAVGRIGCFMNGCCFGRETHGGLSVKFPGDFVPRHPVQLYESAFLFILSFLLFYLSSKKHREGEIFIFYLILYGTGRFLLEFFRGDNALFVFLTIPQWMSIFFFAGAVIFLRSLKKSP